MTRAGREDGQALVETILASLVLLIPVMWLLAVLAEIHSGALAAAAGAREAGFEAARSSDLTSAATAVDAAVARAFEDQGLGPERARVRWDAPHGLGRGGTVEVEVSYGVPVVQFPLLGVAGGPAIDVNARHRARIDPYRSRP